MGSDGADSQPLPTFGRGVGVLLEFGEPGLQSPVGQMEQSSDDNEWYDDKEDLIPTALMGKKCRNRLHRPQRRSVPWNITDNEGVS